MAITLTAVIFSSLIGAALGAGGVWLAVLGGSWYYIFAGLAFLITVLSSLPETRLGVARLCGPGDRHAWLGNLGDRLRLVAARAARRRHHAARALAADAMDRSVGLTGAGAQRTRGARPFRWLLTVLAALVVAGYSMTQDPKQIAGELSEEVIVTDARSWRQRAGRRMASIWPHALWPALFAAETDHAGKRRYAAGCLAHTRPAT